MIDYQSVLGADFLRDDPALQKNFLAEGLKNGELSLFVGAGISRFLKMPLWHELVNQMSRAAGLAQTVSNTSTNEELAAQISLVKGHLTSTYQNNEEYFKTVSEALYSSISGGSVSASGPEYPEEILSQKLLISIGALVMNSRRGSVHEIISFNFDDLLEAYLDLHGFSTQVVSNYPELIRSESDIVVHHPHGFLPYRIDRYDESKSIVLSKEEYDLRLQTPDSPWFDLLNNLFLSKIVLFIGYRIEDEDVKVILRKAKARLSDSRPVGFVIQLASSIDAARKNELTDLGIIPIGIADYEDGLPNYLLELCQLARRI